MKDRTFEFRQEPTSADDAPGGGCRELRRVVHDATRFLLLWNETFYLSGRQEPQVQTAPESTALEDWMALIERRQDSEYPEDLRTATLLRGICENYLPVPASKEPGSCSPMERLRALMLDIMRNNRRCHILVRLQKTFPDLPSNVLVYWAYEAIRLGPPDGPIRPSRRSLKLFRQLADVYEELLRQERPPALDSPCPWKRVSYRKLKDRAYEAIEGLALSSRPFDAKSARETCRVFRSFVHLLDISDVISVCGHETVSQTDDLGHVTHVELCAHAYHNMIWAKLFGIKTEAPGLERLFVGGLLLRSTGDIPHEDRERAGVEGPAEGTPHKPLCGVVRGSYGTGKTLFASYLALEVARLGGVAAILLLEQDPSLAWGTLERFGYTAHLGRLYRVYRDCDRFVGALTDMRKQDEMGALLIASFRGDNIIDIVNEVDRVGRAMETYARSREDAEDGCRDVPRLMVVDSLNAANIDVLRRDNHGYHWIGPTGETTEFFSIRSFTKYLFERGKDHGVACLITSEELHGHIDKLQEEYFTADIVVSLEANDTADPRSPERTFTIEKARGQLHLLGSYPFHLNPDHGFKFHSTSRVAINERALRTRRSMSTDAVTTGVPSLDELFGEYGGPFKGSTTVITGPTGSNKTDLAVLFLLSEFYLPASLVPDMRRMALEVTPARDGTEVFRVSTAAYRSDIPRNRQVKTTLEALHEQQRMANHAEVALLSFADAREHVRMAVEIGVVRKHFKKTSIRQEENGDLVVEVSELPGWKEVGESLRFESLTTGNVPPGHVLDQIRDFFKARGREGKRVARVVVDGVAYMTMNSPMIVEDRSFAVALQAVLRSEPATKMILASTLPIHEAMERRETETIAQIVEGADNVIHCQRLSVRGTMTTALSIRRTPASKHVLGHRELVIDHTGMHLRDSLSLLKGLDTGIPAPIPVRLLLHAENRAQETYNCRCKRTVESLLSANVQLDEERRLGLERGLLQSESSAHEELPIMQIDEAQLSRVQGVLQPIPVGDLNSEEDHREDASSRFTGRLIRKVRVTDDGGSCQLYAVPYLMNVSFLVWKKNVWKEFCEKSGEERPGESLTWKGIAELVAKGNRADQSIWFDFQRDLPENRLCLFLEILMSLYLQRGLNPSSASEGCLLRALAETAPADLQETLETMSMLCGSSDALSYWSDLSPTNIAREASELPQDTSRVLRAMRRDTGIMRHWLSTLVMFFEQKHASPDDYVMTPLPGNITTSGEWYLAMPNYTAATRAGIKLIDMLTSHDAQIHRLQHRVGLPVDECLYEDLKEVPLQGFPVFLERTAAPSEKATPVTLGRIREMWTGAGVQRVIHRSVIACYHRTSLRLNIMLQSLCSTPYDRNRSMEQWASLVRGLVKGPDGCPDAVRCREQRKRLYGDE